MAVPATLKPLIDASRIAAPVLAVLVIGDVLGSHQAKAGPLIRRYQERQACQEFAGKLQAVSGNPQQAAYVYQQGVLKLVATFGSNPCSDIPVPTASAPGAAPSSAPSAASSPASTPAPAPAPGAAPTTAPTTAPAAVAPAAANPQQQQACQEFANKLQTAQGNPSQAQQIYAMGTQKLTGLFGANPCPQVKAP